jgi:single-strand DNA-binding protein
MSLSSITISGTLKKDPEKRFTPTNIPVTNLLIEVSYIPRGSQNNQDNLSVQAIRVNAWRDLAEFCEKKLKTGDKILITGRVQVNAYTTNEGKKRREVEIDANTITLLNDLLSSAGEKNAEFQKTDNLVSEKITDLDEIVSSTEEIPF